MIITCITQSLLHDSDLKDSVDLMSGEWLRAVEENCLKAEKSTIKHLSIIYKKYERLSQKH